MQCPECGREGFYQGFHMEKDCGNFSCKLYSEKHIEDKVKEAEEKPMSIPPDFECCGGDCGNSSCSSSTTTSTTPSSTTTTQPCSSCGGMGCPTCNGTGYIAVQNSSSSSTSSNNNSNSNNGYPYNYP